jgi:uncharacterized protein (DUF736 family)
MAITKSLDTNRPIQVQSALCGAPHNVEIGAAWQRTSKDNAVYHSVKLDDPSFPAPIYANLVAVDEGYALVWSR